MNQGKKLKSRIPTKVKKRKIAKFLRKFNHWENFILYLDSKECKKYGIPSNNMQVLMICLVAVLAPTPGIRKTKK